MDKTWPSELMTIGAFSQRSRLSLKALRIYEGMGLLEPSHVDERNGYRYYSESQLEPALLIGLLRRLDMPLKDIRDVVGLEPESLAKAVTAFWAGIEDAHGESQRLVRYIVRRLSGGQHTMYDIETRDVPAEHVATIEGRVTAPAVPEFIGNSMGRLFETLGKAGVETGVPFVVYHGEVNVDADGPVEVCVPYVGAVTPVDDIRLRIEPAHREAFTRLTKQHVVFPEILDAYEAVERWATTNGNGVAGAPREVYFTDWEAAAPDEPACDIAFPIHP